MYLDSQRGLLGLKNFVDETKGCILPVTRVRVMVLADSCVNENLTSAISVSSHHTHKLIASNQRVLFHQHFRNVDIYLL